MSGTIAPITQLEAVNILLTTIGEAPVNTLQGTSNLADVGLATALLDQCSRQVQIKGYRWNTDTEVTLTPDSNSALWVPANTIRVALCPDSPLGSPQIDIVQRGVQLWDRLNKTFAFKGAIAVNLTYLIPFEQMPEAARWYCAVRAARIFAARMLGSQAVVAFTHEDETTAMSIMNGDAMESGDFTIWDNYDNGQIISRY